MIFQVPSNPNRSMIHRSGVSVKPCAPLYPHPEPPSSCSPWVCSLLEFRPISGLRTTLALSWGVIKRRLGSRVGFSRLNQPSSLRKALMPLRAAGPPPSCAGRPWVVGSPQAAGSPRAVGSPAEERGRARAAAFGRCTRTFYLSRRGLPLGTVPPCPALPPPPLSRRSLQSPSPRAAPAPPRRSPEPSSRESARLSQLPACPALPLPRRRPEVREPWRSGSRRNPLPSGPGRPGEAMMGRGLGPSRRTPSVFAGLARGRDGDGGARGRGAGPGERPWLR